MICNQPSDGNTGDNCWPLAGRYSQYVAFVWWKLDKSGCSCSANSNKANRSKCTYLAANLSARSFFLAAIKAARSFFLAASFSAFSRACSFFCFSSRVSSAVGLCSATGVLAAVLGDPAPFFAGLAAGFYLNRKTFS